MDLKVLLWLVIAERHDMRYHNGKKYNHAGALVNLAKREFVKWTLFVSFWSPSYKFSVFGKNKIAKCAIIIVILYCLNQCIELLDRGAKHVFVN